MKEEKAKYLAIKNWKKYQPDARLRNKSARLPWIKDYTDREQDFEFSSLTMFQRGILEGLCRLAGRTPSRILHNDLTYILRELHVYPTDAPHVRHALATLIAREFLIPTNNEKFFEETGQNACRDREGESCPALPDTESRELRVEVGEGSGSSVAFENSDLKNLVTKPKELLVKKPEGQVQVQKPEVKNSLAEYFLSLLPDQKLNQLAYKSSIPKWERLLVKLTSDREQVQRVMDYAINQSAFWSDKILSVQRCDPMEYFMEKFGDIEAKMMAEFHSEEIRLQKARETAAKTKKAASLGAANADKPAYRQVPGNQIVKEGDVVKF